jgi:hypothetical protein
MAGNLHATDEKARKTRKLIDNEIFKTDTVKSSEQKTGRDRGQKNHYPVRQELYDERIDEFFKIKKDNVLSDQDFEDLHSSAQKISLFEADHNLARSAYRKSLYYRLFNGAFAAVMLKCLMSPYEFLFQIQTIAAVSSVIGVNWLYYYELNQMSKSHLFAMYYMTETKQIKWLYYHKNGTIARDIDPEDIEVIPSSMKALRTQMIQNLNADQKSKNNRMFEKIEAIYIDTKNDLPLKTVERGTWYNQSLWLYLMTKKRKVITDSSKLGQWQED